VVALYDAVIVFFAGISRYNVEGCLCDEKN
jgi:hypothetical protein